MGSARASEDRHQLNADHYKSAYGAIQVFFGGKAQTSDANLTFAVSA